MASRVEMRQQDMVEMYQLLTVYRTTYPDRESMAALLLEDVAWRYQKAYGEEIASRRNPRNAGRKPKYTKEEGQKVIELREKGLSYRQIAEKTGYSLSHVQRVLNERVYRN